MHESKSGIQIKERSGEDAIEVLKTFGCSDAADALLGIEAGNELEAEKWPQPIYRRIVQIPKPTRKSPKPVKHLVIKLAGKIMSLSYGDLIYDQEIGPVIGEDKPEGGRWSSSASNIISRAILMAARNGARVMRDRREKGYRRIL